MSIINLTQAVQLLNECEVVAIPTETVYGLAGKINSTTALRKIFTTKKRPFFDPLIVHIPSTKNIELLTPAWHEVEQFFAETFWPGPLTIIVPKTTYISDLITADQEMVGLRIPYHPLALKLLSMLDAPVAAPSANIFKKTSPSCAEHVEAEFQGRIPILDGGPCSVGIESTVLHADYQKKCVLIYRPGMISLEMIQEKMQKNATLKNWQVIYQKSPVAPGQLEEHYRPLKPLIIFTNPHEQLIPMDTASPKNNLLEKATLLTLNSDPTIAARELYSKIRQAASIENQENKQVIFFKIPLQQWQNPQWFAITERLQKAAHLISSDLNECFEFIQKFHK